MEIIYKKGRTTKLFDAITPKVREEYKIPNHIPDEQVENYIKLMLRREKLKIFFY